MNIQEVRAVLTAAAGYDNRKLGSKLTDTSWYHAAERGRWTTTEAIEAVHAHYAERTDFLMPGHITERIKAARADAAMREPVEHPDPIGQARLTELISGAFQAIGDDDDRVARKAALAVRCPWCKSAPGSECTRSGKGGPVRTTTHPSRFEASGRVAS